MVTMHLHPQVVLLWTIVLVALTYASQPPNLADCPPIPNCARGTTCKEYPHPSGCYFCRCEKCPDLSCEPMKGEICSIVASPNGCGKCQCSPCPDLPACGPGCFKFVPERGCSFCQCDSRRQPEHESGIDGVESRIGDPGSLPAASDVHGEVQRPLPVPPLDDTQRPERIEAQRPVNPADP